MNQEKKKKKNKYPEMKLFIKLSSGFGLATLGSYLITFFFIVLVMCSLIGFISSSIFDDALTKQQNSQLRSLMMNEIDKANGSLPDYYGTDDGLKLNWVEVQAYLKYLEAYSLENVSDRSKTRYEDNKALLLKVIHELAPTFTYTSDKITTITEWDEIIYVRFAPVRIHHKETTFTPITLLTHAKNYKGVYNITYHNVTEVKHKIMNNVVYTITTIRPEVDTFTNTVADYDPLRNLIKSRYKKLRDFDKDKIEEGVRFVTNLAMNYINNSRNFDWVFADIAGFNTTSVVDSSVCPAQILTFYQAAEKEFGIPWWFIAGQSYHESTFNVGAENKKTHCFGLMQVDPRNWLAYGPKLGYTDIVALQSKYDFPGRPWNAITLQERANMVADLRLMGYGNNPAAQIRLGVYQLKGLLKGNINWDANMNGLKRQLSKALNFYSGNGGDAYMNIVLNYALRFKGQSDLAYNPAWPLPGYTKITSAFGKRIHPITGEENFHTGIDIAGPEGATAVAAANGVVESASVRGGYGNCIVIRTGSGEELYYGHLKAFLVKAGTSVKTGDKIALVDSTGASTGNHLHFEVRNSEGPTDPIVWLQGGNK